MNFFLICFIQIFFLWDWDRNCPAQNSFLLKRRVRKEESPHVTSVPARAGKPVLCSKVELFESLHQPTALTFTPWQSSTQFRKLQHRDMKSIWTVPHEQFLCKARIVPVPAEELLLESWWVCLKTFWPYRIIPQLFSQLHAQSLEQEQDKVPTNLWRTEHASNRLTQGL